jgi:hypothetical protein
MDGHAQYPNGISGMKQHFNSNPIGEIAYKGGDQWYQDQGPGHARHLAASNSFQGIKKTGFFFRARFTNFVVLSGGKWRV